MARILPTTEGEICAAYKVGYKGKYRVISYRCSKCGILKWKVLRYEKDTGLCIKCSGKRTVVFAIAGNTKPRPYQSERQRGENNPMWNGGTVIGGNGYRAILMAPNDPLFLMANKTGYVMEHRLVMAQSIGRPLESWEQVHHINGNRTDNRIENLELWKKSQPSGVRQADYHCVGCRCFDKETETK